MRLVRNFPLPIAAVALGLLLTSTPARAGGSDEALSLVPADAISVGVVHFDSLRASALAISSCGHPCVTWYTRFGEPSTSAIATPAHSHGDSSTRRGPLPWAMALRISSVAVRATPSSIGSVVSDE